ncbi:hypothetical protein ACFWSF_10845 [Streptomyces sp. NPDC058611]|uniref:hypothetical protein n=1 Tax=unclassified Streptomyces TaxID=2593676 RepID=UPI003648AA20
MTVFLVASALALGFLTPALQSVEAAAVVNAQTHSQWDDSGLNLPDESDDGDVARRHRSQDSTDTATAPPTREATGSPSLDCHEPASGTACRALHGCAAPLDPSLAQVLRC